MRPFIARFRTRRARYIYDVNTNAFLQVSKAVYDVLPDIGRIDDSAVSRKHAGRHGPAAKRAVLSIRRAQAEDGLFSPHRPQRMIFPWTVDRVKRAIDGEMQQLILEVTDRCNLRCRYCVYSGSYFHRRVHGRHTMAFDMARQAVDLFLSGSASTESPAVTFYGGEPLLAAPLIDRICAYIRDRQGPRVRMHLTTNGTLLKGPATAMLVKHDVSLLVSLDGPSDVHDSMRVDSKGRGTHAQILRNLEALKSAHPEYYRRNVSFNAALALTGETERVHDFFQSGNPLSQGASTTVSYIESIGTDLYDRQVLHSEDVRGLVQLRRRFVEALVEGKERTPFLDSLFQAGLLRIHRRPMRRLGRTVLANGICCPGVRRLYCDINGRLTACERVNNGLTIGSVQEGVDRRAVRSAIRDYIALSERDCLNCWAVRLCKACFASVLAGRFDADRKRQVCRIMRHELLGMMRLYCHIRERNDGAFSYFAGIASR